MYVTEYTQTIVTPRCKTQRGQPEQLVYFTLKMQHSCKQSPALLTLMTLKVVLINGLLYLTKSILILLCDTVHA